MNFIHFILVDNPEDLNEEWDSLVSEDYCKHCLYSVKKDKIVFLSDNIHEPIETQIDSFIEGVRFCSQNCSLRKGIMFNKNWRNINEICQKAREEDYRKVGK